VPLPLWAASSWRHQPEPQRHERSVWSASLSLLWRRRLSRHHRRADCARRLATTAISEPKTNAEVARGIWDDAQPITGTLVEAYLRSRGITLPEPGPEYLRFASRLRHPNGQFFPARIALPTNPKTGASVGGIQRTFLSWSGDGKAQVERGEQKLSLGPCKGGVVRLADPLDRKTALVGRRRRDAPRHRRLRERLLSLLRQVERGQDNLLACRCERVGSGADGGYVRTWRATANGLEAAFAGAKDTCLPLDELGQVEGRELGQAPNNAFTCLSLRYSRVGTKRAEHLEHHAHPKIRVSQNRGSQE
jgi:Domain of unknown function (DUF927)